MIPVSHVSKNNLATMPHLSTTWRSNEIWLFNLWRSMAALACCMLADKSLTSNYDTHARLLTAAIKRLMCLLGVFVG